MTYLELKNKWDLNPPCSGYCGDGWIDMLDKLLEELVAMGFDPKTQVAQIKEKFGTLRFYADDCTDEMHLAIKKAEARSAGMCEQCGKPGVQRPGIWIKTLCDECCRK